MSSQSRDPGATQETVGGVIEQLRPPYWDRESLAAYLRDREEIHRLEMAPHYKLLAQFVAASPGPYFVTMEGDIVRDPE